MLPLAALRQQIADLVAPPGERGEGTRVPAGVPTGIPALDAALSGGGVPCGRLTEIVGARGSGKTTLVRTLVARALADKRWVAYIDASRTLAPADWAPLSESGRLWIVRPPAPPAPATAPAGAVDHGAWCADVLLRSGAFGVVVLDGGAPLTHGVAVRLTRLARDSHAAFVVMRDEGESGRGGRRGAPIGGPPTGGPPTASPSTGGALVGGAVRIRVARRPAPLPHRDHDRWRSLGTRLARAAGGLDDRTPPGDGGGRWRPPPAADGELAPSLRTTFALTLSVEKGGTHHPVEVGCAIDVARRLCTYPEVPDRRGVAPRNRRGERAAPDAPGVRRATDAPDGAGPVERGAGGAGGGATLAHKRRCAEPAIRRDAFLLPPPPSRHGRTCGGTGR